MEIKSEMTNRSKMIFNENNELKNQMEKMAAMKKQMEANMQQMMVKIKGLESNLGEERKKAGGQKLDLAKEIKVWQAKEHQFVNELRKKELLLQSIQDRMRHVTEKENSHYFRNTLEMSQQLIKNGPNFYDGNANSEFTQLIGQNNQNIQAKLKSENRLMRESLHEIQNSMSEIMKTRTELLRVRFGDEGKGESDEAKMDTENTGAQESGLVELRKELLSLRLEDGKTETINVVKENVLRFKKFMDKVDSHNFKIPCEKAFIFEADSDIDEIRNIGKLKDLLKNYKYVVETQDCLMNKAIHFGNKLRGDMGGVDPTLTRMKVLDSDGINKAKQFQSRQRAYLQDCNKDFEEAKQFMAETSHRIEEEKNHIRMKKIEMDRENGINSANLVKNLLSEI